MEWETQAGYPTILVAGVDEAGRGCLAGPVVAAAVIAPKEIDYLNEPWLCLIQDSKVVKPESREELFPLIQKWARASAIGIASVEEIDQLNIYHAAHLAMRRAVESLGVKPAHVLVDGNAIPKGMGISATAIVKGDTKCLSIAAASILAKVTRDRLMRDLENQYPGYGFSVHKGYPTPQHVGALRTNGVTVVHRRTFGPVAELLRLRPGRT